MRTRMSITLAYCLLAADLLAPAGCSQGFFTVPGTSPSATPTAEPKKPYEIAVVGKIAGVPWFERLKAGVGPAAQDFNQNACVVSPKPRCSPAEDMAGRRA